MALDVNRFQIGINRLKKAALEGFFLNKQCQLEGQEGAEVHAAVFNKIDSGTPGTLWGRMTLDLQLPEDAVYAVYAFAGENDSFLRQGVETGYDDFIQDPREPFQKKIRLLELSGAAVFRNSDEILLSGMEGRYLWFGIEISGTHNCFFKGAVIWNPGDLFSKLFPEIYRADNEFLKRYLSIFSTLHVGFDQKIKLLSQYLDVDKAPVEVLPVLARWLGIVADGEFLGPERMRLLLKNAYALSRIKGTKRALCEITKILLDTEPLIIEQAKVHHIGGEQRATYEKLYGTNPMMFTMLIKGQYEQRVYAQLRYLIEQFKPARSIARIVFLGDCSNMDDYCYLGVNARVGEYQMGSLDQGCHLGQNLKMK